MTTYGEFGGPVRPASRAAKRAAERRDESGVALARAGDSEGTEILYLHGYDDEWRVEITVDRIRPAKPGVAYPRCTGGQGEDKPGDYLDLREFNAEREESAQDFGPDIDFYPDELTDILVDLLTPDS
jgi:hypothetical protein